MDPDDLSAPEPTEALGATTQPWATATSDEILADMEAIVYRSHTGQPRFTWNTNPRCASPVHTDQEMADLALMVERLERMPADVQDRVTGYLYDRYGAVSE